MVYFVLGVAVALAAAISYSVGVSLQSLEARECPPASPCGSRSFFVLLIAGARITDERVGRREFLAAATIFVGGSGSP